MVLDEAQQIKNSAARTTQSVRAIPAERRIAMTGTPVENRLSELWSIMQFLNPGMLGSEKAFRERFAIPIERDGDDEAAARLRRITGPFVLRRLKTDRSIIADLPDKLEMKEFCNLTREQATLYQAVVDDMLARIDEAEGMERRGLVLATMMKLKQVCNHPAHFLGDGSSIRGSLGQADASRRGSGGGGGRGRPHARLHPVHRDGGPARAPPAAAIGLRGARGSTAG